MLRFAEQGLRLPVSEELQMPGVRHAESETPLRAGTECETVRRLVRRRLAGKTVQGIRPPAMLQRRERVLASQGEYGNAVQGSAGGENALGADDAAGGLEPHHIVEAGGHPARSGGVRSQSERDQAGGHGHGRSGTGASGDVTRMERVAHGAVRRTRPHQPRGELVHVGLADQDGARRFQARHGRRRGLGTIREGGTGRGGIQALGIDIVLDRKGDAEEGETPGAAPVLPEFLQLRRPRLHLFPGNPGNPDRRIGMVFQPAPQLFQKKRKLRRVTGVPDEKGSQFPDLQTSTPDAVQRPAPLLAFEPVYRSKFATMRFSAFPFLPIAARYADKPGQNRGTRISNLENDFHIMT